MASIVATIISAGGAFGGYMYFKPSNLDAYLRWKGYTLAKSDDENLWRSIYQENKDSFSSVFGEVKEDDKNKWKVIKEYCTKALKKKDYSSHINKAVTWCLDNVKTVEGQIVRNGKEVDNFMDKLEQFKVATAVQGNPDFWKLLKVEGQDFDKKTAAFQQWCTDSLKSEPKANLVGNVDNFCRRKGYSNFSQKLTADGYVRLKQGEIEKKYGELGVAKFNKLNTSKFVVEILGGQEAWDSIFANLKEDEIGPIDPKRFVNLYHKYCQDLDNIKIEKEDYEESYSKYRGICAKEINLKKLT